METRAEDAEVDGPVGEDTIWVSNGYGGLFIIDKVPIEDLRDWWDAHDINQVVGNDKDSCEWGEFKELTDAETPLGGWKKGGGGDDDDEEDGKSIWVANGCGTLFSFEKVPIDENEEVCGDWWDANDIDQIVGNNQGSCEWGEFKELTFHTM